jgi:hypothetical protein
MRNHTSWTTTRSIHIKMSLLLEPRHHGTVARRRAEGVGQIGILPGTVRPLSEYVVSAYRADRADLFVRTNKNAMEVHCDLFDRDLIRKPGKNGACVQIRIDFPSSKYHPSHRIRYLTSWPRGATPCKKGISFTIDLCMPVSCATAVSRASQHCFDTAALSRIVSH